MAFKDVHDWSYWLLFWRSQDQKQGRDQLVTCSKEQPTWGKMNTGNNRLMYKFVCMRESACDGCILQGAQNMTEAVWQINK